MAKFCVKCGSPLMNGPFCTKCGADVRSVSQSMQTQAISAPAQPPVPAEPTGPQPVNGTVPVADSRTSRSSQARNEHSGQAWYRSGGHHLCRRCCGCCRRVLRCSSRQPKDHQVPNGVLGSSSDTGGKNPQVPARLRSGASSSSRESHGECLPILQQRRRQQGNRR